MLPLNMSVRNPIKKYDFLMFFFSTRVNLWVHWVCALGWSRSMRRRVETDVNNGADI